MKNVLILPVIHYQNGEQVFRNAALAADAGCDGVFLIHMQGINDSLAQMGANIKERHPQMLVGANHLGEHAVYAMIRNIEAGLDMTWTDEQLTHSDKSADDSARIAWMRKPKGHMLFSGVAFKHQKRENFPRTAAREALKLGFIPTTSGAATGVAADLEALDHLRGGIGDAPLAVASGVTPANFEDHAPHVTHILIATGISKSFYEFDRLLLEDIVHRRNKYAAATSSAVSPLELNAREERS